MANQRKAGKKYMGWWASRVQQEVADSIAARLGVDRSAVLCAAFDEYADRHGTPVTPESDPEEITS